MSIINLVANLAALDYPAIYLVHSKIVDEAMERGDCDIDGAIASLTELEDGDSGWAGCEMTNARIFRKLKCQDGRIDELAAQTAKSIGDGPYPAEPETSQFPTRNLPLEGHLPEPRPSERSDDHTPKPYLVLVPACSDFERLPPYKSHAVIQNVDFNPKKHRWDIESRNRKSENLDAARPDLHMSVGIYASLIPIAIIGGLTRFHPGPSNLLNNFSQ